MSHADLQATIEQAWEDRDAVTPQTQGPVRDSVEEALGLLDSGKARVAEKGADGNWSVNQWLKKAVLLSFRLNDMEPIDGGPGDCDLVGQGAVEVRRLGRQANSAHAGFRAVPNCIVRHSAYIAPASC